MDRRVYDRLGLYDPSYRVSGDFEMYLRMQSHHVPFIFTEARLSDYRTGGNSTRGAGGLLEGYSIVRHYFGRGVAWRMTMGSAFRKLRLAVLFRILGQERTYRIQTLLRGLKPRATPHIH